MLRTLGILTFNRGEVEASRAFNEDALARFRAVGARAHEAQAHGGMAIVHQRNNDIAKARQALETAMAIYREVGNQRFEGSALANLGTLEVAVGNVDVGRDCYERAIEIHREVGNLRGEGITLGNLGSLHTAAGRTEEAIRLLRRALGIHERVGNRRSAGATVATLGTLHFDSGDLTEARVHLERARALAEASDDPHVLGFVLCHQRRLAALDGGPESPLDLAARGVSLLRGVGYASTLAEGLAVWAELLAHAGDRDAAASKLAEAERTANPDDLYTGHTLRRVRALLEA